MIKFPGRLSGWEEQRKWGGWATYRREGDDEGASRTASSARAARRWARQAHRPAPIGMVLEGLHLEHLNWNFSHEGSCSNTVLLSKTNTWVFLKLHHCVLWPQQICLRDSEQWGPPWHRWSWRDQTGRRPFAITDFGVSFLNLDFQPNISRELECKPSKKEREIKRHCTCRQFLKVRISISLSK